MIDQKAIEIIEKYGLCHDAVEQNRQVLQDMGFRIGKQAEYVIIIGCFQTRYIPEVLQALRNVLDRLNISYSLLEKEYCCGWYTIGKPALKSKSEEDIASFKQLSRQFITKNFEQAKKLGAKSVALFCVGCEPNYDNARDLTDLEVISLSELIDRHFSGGRLDAEIDYYVGCHRASRKLTHKKVDIESPARILQKIDGLKINYLDNRFCCTIPSLLDKLVVDIKTRCVVNICTSCYLNLKARLANEGAIQVRMLPEIVWQALDGNKEKPA